MNIKKIFPLEVNYNVKHFKEKIFQREPNFKLNSNDKKRVFFLDAPEYGNLGDQAIAFSMQKFMKDKFPEYIQYEIQEDKYLSNLSWLKKNISNNDIICLMGGGNMGDLYQRYEAIRRNIIKNFKDNKIIIFPQTIDYGNDKYGEKEKKNSEKIYNKNKNLMIMAREERTFNIMKSSYPNCNVILTPDIVLYLDYKNLTERKNSVGLCLRNDKEKVLKESDKDEILNKYKEHIDISTHIGDEIRIDFKNRKEFVEDKLKQFAQNKLVITDRLHGMIFSYITNTPCMAFNNSNGKIKGVYKWIVGKGNVAFLEEFKEIKFNKMNNEKVDFDNLYENIKSFIKI